MALPTINPQKIPGRLPGGADRDGLATLLWWGDSATTHDTVQVFSFDEYNEFLQGQSITAPGELLGIVAAFFNEAAPLPLQIRVVDVAADVLSASFLQAHQSSLSQGGQDYARLTAIGGAYVDTTTITSLSDAADAMGAAFASLENELQPTEYLFAPDSAGTDPYVTTVSPLATNSFTLSDNLQGVSFIVGGDDDAKNPLDGTSIDISALGTALGTLARNPIQRSLGWTGAPGLGSGSTDGFPFSSLHIDDNPLGDYALPGALNTLDDERVLFLQKRLGKAGAFFNGEWTLASEDSVFRRISRNRIWHKFIAGLSASLVDFMEFNFELEPGSNGKMTSSQEHEFLEAIAVNPDQMVRAGELPGDLGATGLSRGYTLTVTDNTNLLAGNVEIEARIASWGYARTFNVKAGFTTS